MFGTSGGYQAPDSCFLRLRSSVFFGSEKRTPASADHQKRKMGEPGVLSAEAALLIPALAGAGAFFLMNQLFRFEGGKDKQEGSVPGKAGSILYTGIATAGISYYIYQVLIAAGRRPLCAFLPVSWALWVMILYYAAVYNWLYRLSPGSFTGDFGETPLTQLVSFIYFSICTFSTGGWGDTAPKSNTAKILVSLQISFFVFIFTMGLVFFIDP